MFLDIVQTILSLFKLVFQLNFLKISLSTVVLLQQNPAQKKQSEADVVHNK